jgi:hypothetical protein
MKPDWDKLMDEFKGHKTALVADVDCTGAGKDLCSKYGVQGFPTIKWGSPHAMEEYQGAREYSALETFAKENLGPACSPTNLDACDGKKKKELQKYMDMSARELVAEMEKIKEELETQGPDGWCNHQWYSDTVKEEKMSVVSGAVACAAQCSKESKCKMFSISPGQMCHRYEVPCPPGSIAEDKRFTSYKKIMFDGDAAGDLSDFTIVRGLKKEDEDSDKSKKKPDDPRLGLIKAVQAMNKEEL